MHMSNFQAPVSATFHWKALPIEEDFQILAAPAHRNLPKDQAEKMAASICDQYNLPPHGAWLILSQLDESQLNRATRGDMEGLRPAIAKNHEVFG